MKHRWFGLIALLGLTATTAAAASSCSSSPASTTTTTSAATTTGTGGAGGSLPGHCANLTKDGDETDLDCGGSCAPCDPGRKCTTSADCASGACGSKLLCLPVSCADGQKNNKETDTDCGGNDCNPCPSSKHCASNSDCESATCTATRCGCPEGMVAVPIIGGGGAYCIDENEVTNADYKPFYDDNPKIDNLPPGCEKNAYAPYDNWPPAKGQESLPVVYVDWCDAYAFCAWKEIRDGAGIRKHLCGKIGGGQNETAASADATASEWYNACSTQGMNDYPYGHTYKEKACNGADFFAVEPMDGGAPDAGDAAPPEPHLLPVDDKLLVNCQQGTTGLYQMSGNAAEWEASCDDDAGTCLARGGSFDSTKDELTCGAPMPLGRNDNKHAGVGFRCCF
ncbi:MAG: SUMF1/EgtB/PvdO family nonheme iron enzyme [Byssovorax sp.]